MQTQTVEISVKGKPAQVPVALIDGLKIIVTGRWMKVASIFDEDWVEDGEVQNPESVLSQLKAAKLGADVLTFAQIIPHVTPQFQLPYEWDNYAVIPITSYADWWENRLPQESRRNVRLAAKRGVVVKVAEYNAELVRGISEIYNETPTRQGRPFWHYGKDLETVRRENATYAGRSDFIGAYLNDELIGFIKLVHVGGLASIMQILSKNAHFDKKPMNAMLAKAVEICEKRKSRYLLYTQFTYGSVFSPLTEFKRRNGFEELQYPRYYVPLTWKGKLGLKFKLHHGLRDALPPKLVSCLVRWRRNFYAVTHRKQIAVSESR